MLMVIRLMLKNIFFSGCKQLEIIIERNCSKRINSLREGLNDYEFDQTLMTMFAINRESSFKLTI